MKPIDNDSMITSLIQKPSVLPKIAVTKHYETDRLSEKTTPNQIIELVRLVQNVSESTADYEHVEALVREINTNTYIIDFDSLAAKIRHELLIG